MGRHCREGSERLQQSTKTTNLLQVATLEIRFDSLRGSTQRTKRFSGLRRVLTATSPDEVLPALAEIDRAVAEGFHAAGFVSFEAAPAMDRALVARDAHPATPLLHFGIFEERSE